jgi:hypothetical protein
MLGATTRAASGVVVFFGIFVQQQLEGFVSVNLECSIRATNPVDSIFFTFCGTTAGPLRLALLCPATCLLVEGSIGQASRSIEPTSMRASHVPVSTKSQCNQARGRGRKGRIEGVVRILPRPPRIEHRHQRMRKPCRCCRLAEQFDSSSRMHPEPRIRFQRRRQLGQLERHRRRRVAATTWHASRAGCRQSKIPNHCICLALGLTDHAQHTGTRQTCRLGPPTTRETCTTAIRGLHYDDILTVSPS